MIALIENCLNEIKLVCRRHGVASLAVFGSALDGNSFDSQCSDIDFIVSFHAGKDLGPWMGEYFELRRELEELLGRRVDLVMHGASRDLVFAEEGQVPQIIYAAANTQAA